MNYIQYMKPGGNFNSSLWDFNKVDKSKLTPEQIKYAVELYFWRTKDPEMKKQYELWSDYQKRVNASQNADLISNIAAAAELPEVTITMAKPNYIDLIKSGIRNKWTNMSTEDKVHAGIDAATTIGGFIPGVDVVADGADVLHSLQRKDWAGAGIGAAAMVLPFVSAPMLRKIKTLSNTLFSPEARLARSMNKNIRNAKLLPTIVQTMSTTPDNHIRIKVGDVEVNDPKYGYRIINTLQPKTSLAFFERLPAKISEAERLGIPKGDRNLKIKPATNWDPENWFSYRLDKQWTPEDARILAEHVPEYREIERAARLNKTFMKFPDGTTFLGDPREWIMMMSQNGKNVFNPLQHSDIIPSGVYRSGVRNMENAALADAYKRVLIGDTGDSFKYDPLSKDIEVWNGTDRNVTKAFGQNSDLSYDVSDFNIADPKILERINKAEIIKSNEAKFLSELLGFDVDPHYAGNIHLEAYVGNAKELGLTEKQLISAIKQQELFKIAYNKELWPDTDVTYTSLYPVSSSKGKVYVSPDGKMRNWSEILLDDGTIGVTDDAVKEAIKNGFDFTVIKNVREGGMDKAKLTELLNHDLIIHSGTPRVSFLGNNGNLTGIGGVYFKSGGKLNYLNLMKNGYRK